MKKKISKEICYCNQTCQLNEYLVPLLSLGSISVSHKLLNSLISHNKNVLTTHEAKINKQTMISCFRKIFFATREKEVNLKATYKKACLHLQYPKEISKSLFYQVGRHCLLFHRNLNYPYA